MVCINLSPISLKLVPAEEHPSRDLSRLTYELSNPNITADGVVGLARALEHINIFWAIIGGFIRLPIISYLLQLIVDSIGGGPRKVCRT